MELAFIDNRTRAFHPLIQAYITLDSRLETLIRQGDNRWKIFFDGREEISQVILCKNETLHSILFVRWTRLSYHDVEPVPVLYHFSFRPSLQDPPYLRVFREGVKGLQILYQGKMQSGEENEKILKRSSLENSALEIHLTLFTFQGHFAFELHEHYEERLLVFSSAPLLESHIQIVAAYAELLCLPAVSKDLYRAVAEQAEAHMREMEIFQEILTEVLQFLHVDPEALRSLLIRRLEQQEERPIPDRNDPRPCTSQELRAHQTKERGGVFAYDISWMLSEYALGFNGGSVPSKREQNRLSSFIELDLDPQSIVIDPKTGMIDYNRGQLIPALDAQGWPRDEGQNCSGIVIGIQTDDLNLGFPVSRILMLGDMSHKSRGIITAEECARINAAIRYAVLHGLPIDWFPASHGVEIQRERGVESLDASASTIREIVKACHHEGLQINLVVNETNIGAQSYWDALAAIMNETSGILIMTSRGSMALTGDRALVCAVHNSIHSEDIGAHARRIYPRGVRSLSSYQGVHGPNGDATAYAEDIQEACRILIHHHYFSYLQKGDPLVRRRSRKIQGVTPEENEKLAEEVSKLIRGYPPERELMLSILQDPESPLPVKLWKDIIGTERQPLRLGDFPQTASVLVQEMLIGGISVMAIFTPVGPLTPADSEIIARAFYKANHRLPVVVIGSLTGFNCDPLSMENRQLVAGSWIAKAIVEHEGPILIVNMGNLVGGTFVVFSKQLNPYLRILAVEGSHVQVIGGKAAAKVVFHSKICKRVDKDPRLTQPTQFLAAYSKRMSQSRKLVRPLTKERIKRIEAAIEQRRRTLIAKAEKEEGESFDRVHNVERAKMVGSIDAVLPLKQIRELLIHHLEQLVQEYTQTPSNVGF